MMAILLAMVATLSFGVSDFAGGVASRSTAALRVALISQTCAACLAMGAVAITGRLVFPAATDATLAVLAGIGSAIGNVLIYRGIARHAASAVAPASGLVGLALPVIVGILSGEMLNGLQVAGLVLAVPAVWYSSGGSLRSVQLRNGLGLGLGAGLGFGVQFACLGQIGEDAGLAPLAWSQFVSASLLALAVLFRRERFRVPRSSLRWAVMAGVCAGIAAIAFQLSAQAGDLSVVAAVTSLYPAVTVLVAAAAASRWWSRPEAAGLILCAVALVLIAS